MVVSVLMVGCGNMGFAMLETWVRARHQDFIFSVIEPNVDAHDKISALGVRVATSAAAFHSDQPFDFIFLSVKPQTMGKAIESLEGAVTGSHYVSIAAGLPITFFEKHLGADAAIIRCMPNTPAAVNAGALALCTNSHVAPDALALIQELLAHNGLVHLLSDEAQMDAITAISGSGPAYVFHMAECLELAAMELGLEPELARDFARQTIYGAGALLHQSPESAAHLREAVTSPNGTTQAGLEVLMRDQALQSLILATAKAAETRSEELGRELSA